MNLDVKLLNENAKVPARSSPHAAGLDLFSAYDYEIPGHSRLLCSTEIALAIPKRHYGRIAPRSGLAVNNFIDVGAGVIDSDYRGPVGILLFNFSDNPFKISRGDRVAQLIIEKIAIPSINVVESLPNSTRGQRGFGSTGV
jgi:dUTP pyrophosphatase